MSKVADEVLWSTHFDFSAWQHGSLPEESIRHCRLESFLTQDCEPLVITVFTIFTDRCARESKRSRGEDIENDVSCKLGQGR